MLPFETGRTGTHAMLMEMKRLRALHELEVLDTPRERPFDIIVERALGCVPGVSIAAISLIDTDRQWFKAAVGLDITETPRSISFCDHVIRAMKPLVVEDATKDARFVANPLVTGAQAIRLYAGVPLADGVGALCVIGTEPRWVTAAEMARLTQLAKFVDIHLSVHGTRVKLKRRS